MKIFDITDIEFNGVKVDSLKEFQHEKILVCEDKSVIFYQLLQFTQLKLVLQLVDADIKNMTLMKRA